MKEYDVECIQCGARYSKEDIIYTCSKCGGLLDIKYDYSKLDVGRIVKAKGEGVWKYREEMPKILDAGCFGDQSLRR